MAETSAIETVIGLVYDHCHWDDSAAAQAELEALLDRLSAAEQALREIAELSLEEHLGYGHERTLSSRMADIARAALAGRGERE